MTSDLQISFTKPELDELHALQQTRYLVVSLTALFIYDYLLTIKYEVQHFWSSQTEISAIIFFFNRYAPTCDVIITLIGYFTLGLSSSSCSRILRAGFVVSVLYSLSIQATLVLRIWYLFPRNKTAGFLAVVLYAISAVATLAILGMLYQKLRGSPRTVGFPALGCTLPETKYAWTIWIPAMVLHTILFLFTAFRAVKARSLRSAPFLQRLLRDGGFFFLVIFGIVSFCAIGSAGSNLAITYAGSYTDLSVILLAISISRVMFSIRSISAGLSSDPVWVLGDAEMDRIITRRGVCEAEIVVDYLDLEEAD